MTDGIPRFLTDGETVTLTLDHMTGTGDAEFLVNGDKGRRMLFSQFASLFLRCEGRGVHSGIITTRGISAPMAAMDADTFASLVSGRRFVIRTDDTMYALNTMHPKCACFERISEVRDYICNALEEGRYDDIAGMARWSTCYSLVEVA